jgi:hypothetical protein
MVTIAGIRLGASAQAWAETGFAVADNATQAGSVPLTFGAGSGIEGWSLRGAGSHDLDGLATEADEAAPAGEEVTHPNGTTRIDHLVVFTPDLERTTAALEAAGIERRRVREVDAGEGKLRQGFFRLGEVILEVVEHARVPPGPASFWGITFAVADLDACAELLGERLGSIRDAVQPGRRIATLHREAGLGLPVALISEKGS